MRIISGIYGGRRLETPKNNDIRPTSDKIRGAIFNMIGSRMDLDGAHVLDAFCGSGALGLEALSRGAAHCTFIDKFRASLDLCKRNIETFGANSQADFHLKDSAKSLDQISNKPFDLILLDPPYNKGLILATLESLKRENLIALQGIIVVETERRWRETLPDGLELETEKTYGDTKITILRAI